MKNANEIAANVLRQQANGNFVDGMTKGGAMLTVGNGSTMYVGEAKSLEELKAQKAREEFNKAYEEVEEEIANKLAKAEEKTKKAERYLNSEIVPVNNYILVRPFSENPFDKLETTESGIILTPLDGEFMNPDTGNKDTKQKLERVAEVIEVNPNCKHIKVGDVIMYRFMQGVPVPFFHQGLEVVAETQILVVINEGLRERFGMV